jgi:catechol 2,3-dioxygenase-like lactoylglutathione lyase family enzyme
MLRDSPAFSGYSVSDQAVAKTFYEDVLGCSVTEDQMGLQLGFSNGHNVFLYEKADHVPATYTVLNFPVDSIDTTVDGLVEKGVTMERYDSVPAPQDEKGILRGKAAGMGPDIAWFKDPFGNVLAVLES